MFSSVLQSGQVASDLVVLSGLGVSRAFAGSAGGGLLTLPGGGFLSFSSLFAAGACSVLDSELSAVGAFVSFLTGGALAGAGGS